MEKTDVPGKDAAGTPIKWSLVFIRTLFPEKVGMCLTTFLVR